MKLLDRKRVYFLIGCFSFAFLVIGATYAYFTASITNNNVISKNQIQKIAKQIAKQSLLRKQGLSNCINKKFKNDCGLDLDSNQHFEQIAASLSLTNQEVTTWPTTRGQSPDSEIMYMG